MDERIERGMTLAMDMSNYTGNLYKYASSSRFWLCSGDPIGYNDDYEPNGHEKLWQ